MVRWLSASKKSSFSARFIRRGEQESAGESGDENGGRFPPRKRVGERRQRGLTASAL